MTNPLKFIGKWLTISLLAALIIGFLFLIGFLGIVYYAQSSAYTLAPSEYPHSELLEKWQSGGPDSMWDRRTYRTSDSVDEVFMFFEELMPGFERASNSGTTTETYYNSAHNNNWLAKRAAEFACTGLYCTDESVLIYPSASIRFYPDPDNPTGTLIEVWLSWPAP
ncbi:MAG: hypothetical protein IPM53_19570 [Anaerolineaceae bacterium]|nr:hypothetical protein [Anaerolineaceae bacterium]